MKAWNMLNPLVAAIDALLAFAGKHACEGLDPSSLLTQDQIGELTTLDTEFYAHCQLSGLTLSIEDNGLSGFGNAKLPYISSIIHLPVKDEAGNGTHEMVASGMMIMPTPGWKHALMSLRETAVLKARAEENGKDRGASQSTTSDNNEDDHGAGRKSEKRKRGRPAGSKTSCKKKDAYGAGRVFTFSCWRTGKGPWQAGGTWGPR
jgi:hypothetical protein